MGLSDHGEAPRFLCATSLKELLSVLGGTLSLVGPPLSSPIDLRRVTAYLVEIINKPDDRMATVNYSVPEAVKRAFNETFRGRNKSAIIAELMQRAVEEEERKARRSRAVDALLARREQRPAASEDEVRRIRDGLRAWP